MSISIGSSSDAMSYIQSLLQSVGNLAGNAAGVGPVGDWLKAAGDGAGAAASGGQTAAQQAFGMAPPPFKDSTMAALIALKGQDSGAANGAGSAQSLFSKIDTDGDGKITQSELKSALSPSGVDSASADALFTKLDRNGDGSVDMGELTSATRRGHGRHHHQMAAGGADSLLNATGADGSKSQTATNADGSSTTTITYADGSTVTMTTPAAPATGVSSGSGAATQGASGASPVNMIEQLIKTQAQLIAKQGATVSAVV